MEDKQLTEEEAKALYDSGDWKDWCDAHIVRFQLFQDRPCVPFDRFHKAMERVLGRPVWRHEFADAERLREEYSKDRSAPSLEDILAQVPAEKLIVVAV